MHTLVVIDGNAILHRAYHGIGRGFNPVVNGMPVGMVYGFGSTLLHVLDFFRPECLCITFDTKEKTFRHEMDQEYKAHRTKAPDDFYPQVPLVYQMLDAFGVSVITQPGYESDDLVGTIAKKAEHDGMKVKIVSSDLDFLQLVSDDVQLVKIDGKIDTSPQMGPAETEARYGITPDQMIDFKAICGDSSDNYKGVGGVGPKTAADLLQQYQTLQGIYDHLDELKPKVREKFENDRDYVFHCQKLAAIHLDTPLPGEWKVPLNIDIEGAQHFLEKMHFRSLVPRLYKLNKKSDQNGFFEQKKYSDDSSQKEQMSLF